MFYASEYKVNEITDGHFLNENIRELIDQGMWTEGIISKNDVYVASEQNNSFAFSTTVQDSTPNTQSYLIDLYKLKGFTKFERNDNDFSIEFGNENKIIMDTEGNSLVDLDYEGYSIGLYLYKKSPYHPTLSLNVYYDENVENTLKKSEIIYDFFEEYNLSFKDNLVNQKIQKVDNFIEDKKNFDFFGKDSEQEILPSEMTEIIKNKIGNIDLEVLDSIKNAEFIPYDQQESVL